MGVYASYVEVAILEWGRSSGEVRERLRTSYRLVVLNRQLKHGLSFSGRASL
jgi:hypothetical protein